MDGRLSSDDKCGTADNTFGLCRRVRKIYKMSYSITIKNYHFTSCPESGVAPDDTVQALNLVSSKK